MQLNRLVGLGTYLVVQIRSVKRRHKHGCILHTQILDNVLLHLRCRRGCQRQNRSIIINLVHCVTQTTVFRTEVVSPFRNTVRLVNGKKRDIQLLQKFYRILLAQRLGCHIQQFCATLQQVVLHLLRLRLRKRRVQKVRHTVLTRRITHRVHLVFHQCD